MLLLHHAAAGFTGAMCNSLDSHGRCVPVGGWCDSGVSTVSVTRSEHVHADDETLLALVAQGDAAFDDREQFQELHGCHKQRADLMAALIAEYKGTAADAARASAGAGIVSTGQGNSPVAQFAFLVRWTLHTLQQHGRRAAARPMTVCETGFNWGLSSLAFLCASPQVRVRSFDLPSGWPGSGTPTKPYLGIARKWLEQRYPDARLNLTLGDSLHTVPRLAALVAAREPSAPPCDLTFVDGGHTFGHAYADLRSMRCAARRRSLVLVDDCVYAGDGGGKPGVRVAWIRLINESRVRHLAQVRYGGHAGCLGVFL